jgi:hypothetical protein
MFQAKRRAAFCPAPRSESKGRVARDVGQRGVLEPLFSSEQCVGTAHKALVQKNRVL